MLLKVQYFLIKVDVQVGGRCGIYDSWNLVPSCLIMLGNPVSCASRTFLVKVYIRDREPLTDHHLDLNTLHLFVYRGSFRKGAGELDLSNGPVSKASIGLGLGPAWACVQGWHEAGLWACMGPGSRCRIIAPP